MAAATTDIRTQELLPHELAEYTLAANTIIYDGTLVNDNGAGYSVPAADTATHKFLGVATKKVDNSTGVAGAKKITLKREGVFVFGGSGFAITDVGKKAYVVDDSTVGTGDASVTEGIYVGVIEQFISSTKVAVRLDPIGARQHLGTVQLFTFEQAGPNATTFDLSTVAGYYGGTEIFVERVLWMDSIAAGTPDDYNRLVVTTDYTLSASTGVLTAVNNLSALTIRAAVLGRLKN